MACINPRIIKNPIRSFLYGADKPVLEVPCGKCEGCRKDKSNEWWIRSRQEIIDTMDKGGRVFFPTFTYSERCLPKHFYRDSAGKECYFPCFNHHDKDRYLNSIRKHFERDGITEGFKYIWVSEYGETQTHRPHYHALFFFDSSYNVYSDSELESLIRDTWHFGRVDANDELGMKVNVIYKDRAAGYVSKYTTKDYDYFEQPLLKKFIEEKGFAALNTDKIKAKLPKRFNSQGFGKGLVDAVLDDVHINRRYDYFEKGVQLFMSDGSVKKFNLPRYIFDKICYTKDRETGFKLLTEIGQEVRRRTILRSIQDGVITLQSSLLEINLRSEYTDSDIYGLVPHDRPQTVASLVDYIKELMAGRSYTQLITYKNCFRDINYYDDEYDLISEYFDNDSRLMNYGVSCVNYRSMVSIDDRLAQDYDEDESYFNTLKDYEQRRLLKNRFNNHPCFKDFDLILDIVKQLQTIRNSRNLKVAKEKENRNREIKNILKNRQNQIRTLSRTATEALYRSKKSA